MTAIFQLYRLQLICPWSRHILRPQGRVSGNPYAHFSPNSAERLLRTVSIGTGHIPFAFECLQQEGAKGDLIPSCVKGGSAREVSPLEI